MMTTEVWFRNPHNYIRELIECGVSDVVWDRGILAKKGIDAVKHAELYFGSGMPYRLLLVGEQGTAEIRQGNTLQKPHAVYPTWVYGEDTELLQEMIERPVGEDKGVCFDTTVAPDERPVFGQEHRVVVIGSPGAGTGPGRKFLTFLKSLQEDNPQCIVHLHGPYSYRIAFGMGWRSSDVEPRIVAQKGKVTTPSGTEMLYEHVQQHANWVTVLGFKPGDLSTPRVRCMYNIKSALWAGKHYAQLYNFQPRRSSRPVDIETPDENYTPPETKSPFIGKVDPKEGDKFHCDTCSLQTQCRYQRAGAVCSVPDAEPAALAKFFNTRNSDLIIQGLGVLVAANSRRLERGMDMENAIGDLDPEVTKLLNQVFTQGTQLAKLVDPNLRGNGVKVNIGVGSGGTAQVAVAGATPGELIGGVVRELEARGYKREEITPDLVKSVLAAAANPEGVTKAIEGKLVTKED
jgi:hypothetical protein